MINEFYAMTLDSTVWTSTCIHFAKPWETFLVKSLKPFVDSISRTGIADRYYFERCEEEDTKINLYIRSTGYVMETFILPSMKIHFNAYFQSAPHFSQSDPGIENSDANKPNFTLLHSIRPDESPEGIHSFCGRADLASPNAISRLPPMRPSIGCVPKKTLGRIKVSSWLPLKCTSEWPICSEWI